MQFLDYFLATCGSVTLLQVVYIVLSISFAVFVAKQVRNYFIKRYEQDKIKDEHIKEALEAVRKYPEYRKQSLEIQEQFNQEIKSIKDSYLNIEARLDKMERESQLRELNKCRDRLIQMHRYYTDKNKNPHQAWTQMEADSFWALFQDYDAMHGNGYVHTEIQPDMERLEVISMSDSERVAELMHSRN